jgi:DNA-binding PadR family transcriptional regulator
VSPGAPDLSPGEWAVLGTVAEGPTHGFAVAQLLQPDGALGHIWSVPRPLVYQILRKLLELGLVAERATQPSARGPARTILGVTPGGRRVLRRWLATPVDHVRDVRSLLLLKLALIDRSGGEWATLVDAQRQRLAPLLESLEGARHEATSFDRVVVEWRLASCRATLDFLDKIEQPAARR